MIKYYPLNRIKMNLYTSGGQFRLPDGKDYVGRYYLTYNNKAFAGANPYIGTNEPLERLPPKPAPLADGPAPSPDYTRASNQGINKRRVFGEIELEELKPYYPIPLESDYQKGYFTRYFAKYVTGPGYIVEISENDFSSIRNGLTQTNMLAYEVDSMLWQLTGPLKDTRVSQYQIKGGVETTNKRVTEAKERTFKGIIAYIGGDYTKFARIV